MKLRRSVESDSLERDPIDELATIRRELPRAERDLAPAEERCAAHEEDEAELVEHGLDQYLDGVDPVATERERADFDRRKISEERERDRLRTVVERLRSRGADLAESFVIEKERAADEKLQDLQTQRGGALALIARLDGMIAADEESRFDLARERLDARAEFDPRSRHDWGHEDQQEIRRWVDLHIRGLAAQELSGPPAHLRERIEKAVAAMRDPERLAAERARAREALIASGNYSVWPSGDDPGPVRLDPNLERL